MQFIADLERNDDGGLQIMYGIDGRRDLTESVREDLSGYGGARPVRIGNGAFDQRQNDVFGAALDAVLLHSLRSQRIPRRLWPLVQAQADCAQAVWRQPDQGIWEARGKPRHYVSSKLMCWVALDRAAELAAIRGESDLAAGWEQTASDIKADILEHGLDERGVLRQHYETDALDASTLLAAIFGFLPGSDARLRATVLAVADELTENGFVLRYRTEETDDGLSGKEGSFVICSFWLVSALAIVGETQRARDLMSRLVKVASPLGLFAEEYDARDRQTPRQLPAGLLAPRPGRGCRADHRRRGPRRSGPLSSDEVSQPPAATAAPSPAIVAGRRDVIATAAHRSTARIRANQRTWQPSQARVGAQRQLDQLLIVDRSISLDVGFSHGERGFRQNTGAGTRCRRGDRRLWPGGPGARGAARPRRPPGRGLRALQGHLSPPAGDPSRSRDHAAAAVPRAGGGGRRRDGPPERLPLVRRRRRPAAALRRRHAGSIRLGSGLHVLPARAGGCARRPRVCPARRDRRARVGSRRAGRLRCRGATDRPQRRRGGAGRGSP